MSTQNAGVYRSLKLYHRPFGHAGGRLVDVTSPSKGADLCVALYEAPPYDLKVAPMPTPRLSINLRGAAVSGSIGGERARKYSGQRYSLFFTPPQADAHWTKAEPSRHLNIYFEARLFEELAEGQRGTLVLDRPLLDVRLSGLKPWVDALERTMACGTPFAEDASFGLARLILAVLAHQSSRRVPTFTRGVLAELRDYVIAHMDAPVRVADLSAVAGVTPTRFALAFSATTGLTPHRFVLDQRLARATHLLQHSSMEISEVAIICGFSSQQHLTTTMRRLVGRTPGQVRREV
jgi:AraC-like DNA-binding protein